MESLIGHPGASMSVFPQLPLGEAESEKKPALDTTHPRVASTGRGAMNIRGLVVLLALGLLVRVGLLCWSSGQPVRIVDAQDYDRLAAGLVKTGAYITPSGALSSQRPPLYPWLVAQIYRVFGLENYPAVRAVQMVLSLLTVVVIYRLGCLIYSEQVGWWAAAFTCFYPSLLGFNMLLLSESLFTLLVCAGTWLTAEAVERQSLRILLMVGVVSGLAALTRSVVLVFLPFLAIYLLLVCADPRGKSLSHCALPIIFFAVTIAPWSYRNTQVQQVFTLIDVMGAKRDDGEL